MATSQSNQTQTIMIVVTVLVVLSILAVGAVYMMKTKSPATGVDVSGSSQMMGTSGTSGALGSSAGVTVQPTQQAMQPEPTAPASLDAGEADVNTKLNGLDTDSKNIDQGMNATVPDLSQ